jgi:hypothetical protein
MIREGLRQDILLPVCPDVLRGIGFVLTLRIGYNERVKRADQALTPCKPRSYQEGDGRETLLPAIARGER